MPLSIECVGVSIENVEQISDALQKGRSLLFQKENSRDS